MLEADDDSSIVNYHQLSSNNRGSETVRGYDRPRATVTQLEQKNPMTFFDWAFNQNILLRLSEGMFEGQ